jgi:hypothetical protein
LPAPGLAAHCGERVRRLDLGFLGRSLMSSRKRSRRSPSTAVLADRPQPTTGMPGRVE